MKNFICSDTQFWCLANVLVLLDLRVVIWNAVCCFLKIKWSTLQLEYHAQAS